MTSFSVNTIASSLAGATPAGNQQAATRRAEGNERARRRQAVRDRLELKGEGAPDAEEIEFVEPAERARTAKDATGEESAEDRIEHGVAYRPPGYGGRPAGGSLDLSA